MRAWIEVSYTSSGNVRNIVALYMRAWIEVYHIHNGNFRS